MHTQLAPAGAAPFDSSLRLVLAEAFELAAQWEQGQLSEAHLAWGLLRAAHRAGKLVDLEATKGALRRAAQESNLSPRSSEKPAIAYDSLARRLLDATRVYASREGAAQAGVPHLQMAMEQLATPNVRELLQEETPAVDVGASSDEAVDLLAIIMLDDTASRSYGSQIMARIKEAIAAGRLLPGDRLPSIRHLAEAGDLAPGTVARAFKALEQEGVLITSGRHGTTVAPPPYQNRDKDDRIATLTEMLKPVAVEAYHLGCAWEQLLLALRQAAHGVVDGAGS